MKEISAVIATILLITFTICVGYALNILLLNWFPRAQHIENDSYAVPADFKEVFRQLDKRAYDFCVNRGFGGGYLFHQTYPNDDVIVQCYSPTNLVTKFDLGDLK